MRGQSYAVAILTNLDLVDLDLAKAKAREGNQYQHAPWLSLCVKRIRAFL